MQETEELIIEDAMNGKTMIEAIAQRANDLGLKKKRISKLTVKNEFGRGVKVIFQVTATLQIS